MGFDDLETSRFRVICATMWYSQRHVRLCSNTQKCSKMYASITVKVTGISRGISSGVQTLPYIRSQPSIYFLCIGELIRNDGRANFRAHIRNRLMWCSSVLRNRAHRNERIRNRAHRKHPTLVYLMIRKHRGSRGRELLVKNAKEDVKLSMWTSACDILAREAMLKKLVFGWGDEIPRQHHMKQKHGICCGHILASCEL